MAHGRTPLLLLFAIVLLCAVVYSSTAARDIVAGDSTEFVTVAFSLGVAHPPGYPLLALLGHVLTLVPLEPPPFRVNLSAVLFHALTVGLVYLTALRLTRRPIASAIAALALAFVPIFWRWSLAIEAFSLNDLFAAALVYLVVRWHEEPGRSRFLVGAALVGGLALANHQTIALLGPVVVLALWRHRAVLPTRRVIGLAAVAALVALTPYAYLPWAASRDPSWNWGDISTFSDLVDHVLRREYGAAQLVSDPGAAGGSPIPRVAALIASYQPLEVALVGAGAWVAYRRLRWYFWFSLAAFAATGPAFAAYANLDVSKPLLAAVLERFFLLPHLMTAPLGGLGIARLLELGSGLAAERVRPPVERGVALAAAAAVALSALAAFPLVDQRQNRVARNYGEDILASVAPGSLLLVGGDAAAFALSYLQGVEAQRRDVTLVILPLLRLDWYVPQLRRRHPDLAIPFERYDGELGSMKALVDANRQRTVGLVGVVLDESLVGSYYYFNRGLVQDVTAEAGTVPDRLVRENERLLGIYRPPPFGATRPESWERAILEDYALGPYRVGKQFADGGLYTEARRWYERALSLDPELKEAREALAALPAR